MIGHALWYSSRATGLVSLLLLSATVVLGALNTGRLFSRSWPRFAVAAVHRNLSLISLVFLTVHVATAVIDPYAGIGWLDAIVPFGSVYRPLWLGLGAVAGDLFLAILATSLLRQRLGARLWRLVHWASYLCWPVALLHGLGTGTTDRHTVWVIALDVGCVLVVAGAIAWRLLSVHPDTTARRGGRVTS
ncbi:ferric reductase-like transmembrane domain-containing protein [Actinoplanes subtropicus]|uniref:ferric reductase-like transmembrane domain-containing protein n=1 Tax=Actinoplanes subtropicus TaxID=543632 RepID=UPI0004C4490A|nr:ferric reductase-like transmembrane domain-containing protein [Actinoplanes subtropicus]